MILTVLIGNTNTRLNWFLTPAVIPRERSDRGISPIHRLVVRTEEFITRPDRHLVRDRKLSDAAIASVVPRATPVCRLAIRHRLGVSPLLVTKSTETGLKIHCDRRQLGADRICAAVGAHLLYPGNLVVLDFGTAITVNVITASGHFLGGAIIPSQALMLQSLHQGTARLPETKVAYPRSAIQHGTIPAIQAGTTQLIIGGLAHITRRIELETGHKHRVIATGGRARFFSRLLKRTVVVEEDLAARGLLEILRLARSASPPRPLGP